MEDNTLSRDIKEPPTLGQVLDHFGFTKKYDIVLNVYLTGSRVYGTQTPTSDWDFVFIVKSEYGEKKLFDDEEYLNAVIFPLNEFNTMIKEHHYLALYLVFLPKEFIWKETISTTKLLKNWEYNEAQLKRTHFQKGSSSLNRAKVYCRQAYFAKESDNSEATVLLRRAKKMICHSLRFLQFGLQIAESGHIIDYKCANKYWEELKDDPSYEWKHYEEKYRPIYTRLRDMYPDVPVAAFNTPIDLKKKYHKLYQFNYDSGSSNISFERKEKEVMRIVRIDLCTLPKEERETIREEFISYFKEFEELYDELILIFEGLCKELQIFFDDIKEQITEKCKEQDESVKAKAFASIASKYQMKTPLFRMYKGNLSAITILSNDKHIYIDLLLKYVHIVRDKGLVEAIRTPNN